MVGFIIFPHFTPIKRIITSEFCFQKCKFVIFGFFSFLLIISLSSNCADNHSKSIIAKERSKATHNSRILCYIGKISYFQKFRVSWRLSLSRKQSSYVKSIHIFTYLESVFFLRSEKISVNCIASAYMLIRTFVCRRAWEWGNFNWTFLEMRCCDKYLSLCFAQCFNLLIKNRKQVRRAQTSQRYFCQSLSTRRFLSASNNQWDWVVRRSPCCFCCCLLSIWCERASILYELWYT